MFTLRKLSGKRVEMNFILGESYTLIHKTRNPREWGETIKANNLQDLDDCIYAFIFGLDKGNPHQISNHQTSYIMVEGKTVDVITE